MERLEILEKMLKELEERDDIIVDRPELYSINITIQDFDGFDEEGAEIEREYNEPEKVENLINWLKDNADSTEKIYYEYFMINTMEICLGYASFDI